MLPAKPRSHWHFTLFKRPDRTHLATCCTVLLTSFDIFFSTTAVSCSLLMPFVSRLVRLTLNRPSMHFPGSPVMGYWVQIHQSYQRMSLWASYRKLCTDKRLQIVFTFSVEVEVLMNTPRAPSRKFCSELIQPPLKTSLLKPIKLSFINTQFINNGKPSILWKIWPRLP